MEGILGGRIRAITLFFADGDREVDLHRRRRRPTDGTATDRPTSRGERRGGDTGTGDEKRPGPQRGE